MTDCKQLGAIWAYISVRMAAISNALSKTCTSPLTMTRIRDRAPALAFNIIWYRYRRYRVTMQNAVLQVGVRQAMLFHVCAH